MEPWKDELYHYGVLGMHWGVRRYQPYSTTGPRKGGKEGKEIGEAARAGRGRDSGSSGKIKRFSNPFKKKPETTEVETKGKPKSANNKPVNIEDAFEIMRNDPQYSKPYKKSDDGVPDIRDLYNQIRTADINSGSALRAKPYMKSMTDDELRRCISRINMENSLNELAKKERDASKIDYLGTYTKYAKKIADAADVTVRLGKHGKSILETLGVISKSSDSSSGGGKKEKSEKQEKQQNKGNENDSDRDSGSNGSPKPPNPPKSPNPPSSSKSHSSKDSVLDRVSDIMKKYDDSLGERPKPEPLNESRTQSILKPKPASSEKMLPAVIGNKEKMLPAVRRDNDIPPIDWNKIISNNTAKAFKTPSSSEIKDIFSELGDLNDDLLRRGRI